MPAKIDNWDSFEESYTYVQLSKDASPKELSAILGQVSALINNSSKSGSFSFSIQELNNITPSWLYLINDIGGGIGWSKIWAEIGIALLILVAACFNYTNLTIARALTRAKEVGIRKVSGAVRHQVFMQYIIESVVIALFALALAGVFLQLILTYKPFNDGYEMVPDLQPGISIFLWFMLFAVVTGAIAGAAPAWILSAFKPVQVLKNISTHKLFGNISLQKALIVFQFSLSLVIIIFLSSFYRQFSYMGVAEHGFNKDNILSISLNGADAKLLSAEAAGIAGVDNLTAVSGNFGRQATGIMYASPDKAHDYSIQLNYYFSDAGLIPTMGLKVVAGNNFPANTANDRERYILLNEKAVQAFKFSNNHDAVGKLIWLSDTTQVQVAGVIKDFYHAGVGRSIAPLAIRQLDGTYNFLNVYVNDPDKDAIAGRMAAAWKKVNPGKPFNYSWLGRDIYEMNAQTATMSLLGFLAFMAIAIASLGLLGLVIYTVETRRKEISIRKVIGASVQTLMVLLSGGFIKLLFIAGLIAMPTGYVLSVFFLQNFANRVPLGFGWVALCFMLLLVIGLVTILSQTYKASVANPVEHLKSE